MKYTITIITDSCKESEKREVEDMLVVALARCGYSPYLNWDNTGVCFGTNDEQSIEEVTR